MAVLEIKDLHVSREGKEILKGVNLKTGPGEVHAKYTSIHITCTPKI
jgi:Fe-S cluster assembly ATP-binding protein